MEYHRYDKFSGQNMENENEDCLFLNVFSPYEPEDEGKLYPVLVWIHGGSFLAGSGDTGIDMEVVAKNFVFNGVALVTLNYRLGPLGFLNWQVGDVTEGNFGIWDQLMALEWVQANMKQLNGDPSRITLIGESAGAASVSLLAVSPKTKDMVHQVIALSGSATAGWAIHRHGASSWSAENVAAFLRCEKQFDDNDISDLLRATGQTIGDHCNLQETIADCLINGGELQSTELVDCLRYEANFSSFLFRRALANELGVSKMVVDKDLVPMSGVELIRDNARIPIMLGVANSEWAHKKSHFYNFRHYGNVTREDCNESVRKIINGQYHSSSSHRLHNSTLELIANATFLRYVDTPDADWSLPRIVSRLQDLEADIEFVAPAQREIDAYVENGIPVYAYSFDYVPRSPIYEEERRSYTIFGSDILKVTKKETQMFGQRARKAFHGLDHAYIFTHGYSSNVQIEPFTKRDRQMSKMLTTMITNFVKNGNPTSTPWNGFKWPPYTNYSAEYAILDLPPKMAKGSLHWPVTNFWNKEAVLLEEYTIREKGTPKNIDELTNEERLQLSAYRRAWWALWLLVAAIALVIWLSVICIVVTRCHSPRAKPYDNIVVNR
ncbi:Acetylcholinesterase [Toxocara canis]|uniref:Acetylcholinesterase n=1 Tax=Toxocara canis TaxID=6265 RepID=A0A0B2UZJ3_TOXCA|nr:Acetylcholinesterase [Toxocara canis]